MKIKVVFYDSKKCITLNTFLCDTFTLPNRSDIIKHNDRSYEVLQIEHSLNPDIHHIRIILGSPSLFF